MAAKYEDVLSIDTFTGLNQGRDNLRMSFASAGYNFEVRHGTLRSTGTIGIRPAATSELPAPTVDPETYNSNDLIGTLGFISQRWKYGLSGVIPAHTTWAITVLNGKIYARKSVKGLTDGFWNTDWVEIYDGGFQQDLFDVITYEMNMSERFTVDGRTILRLAKGTITGEAYDETDAKYYPVIVKDIDEDDTPEIYYVNDAGETIFLITGEKFRILYDYPVDALVMSNSKDGMYVVYCDVNDPGEETTLKVVPVTIQTADTRNATKFGCIARYAERIWGAGIETDPDKLMYSAPYDIFNWEQNNDEPDDGAGDIQQPDWDGDGFKALRQFGNQLVCFKKNSMWAITGTTPSAFYMQKQYGEGTIYEDSISVYGGSVFFVTDGGMNIYDGISVSPVLYGYIEEYLNTFKSSNIRNVMAAACQGKYYFTMAGDVLVYDSIERTISVKRFAGTGRGLYAMTVLDDEVYTLVFEDGCMKLGTILETGAEPFMYRTAWQDFGAMNVVKSEFEVYLMLYSKMGGSIKMTVGIETENRLKEKEVILENGKYKRVRLNARGRKMRLCLKTNEETDAWIINSGIQIRFSLDYD